MSFPEMPKDAISTPIACVYIPGTGWAALQGSSTSNTDGSSNASAPANMNLSQIGSIATQMAGADNLTGSNVLAAVHYRFNGLSVDQDRGNEDSITLLNVSNVTVSQTSSLQTNYNWRGCIVVLQTTTIGSGSITLSIQGVEPVNSYVYTILAGTAVTTNTTVVYRVYPGLTASANSVASDILPRSWQVLVTANNANAATYNVQAMMVL